MQKFHYFVYMHVMYVISFATQVPEYNTLYFSSSNSMKQYISDSCSLIFDIINEKKAKLIYMNRNSHLHGIHKKIFTKILRNFTCSKE